MQPTLLLVLSIINSSSSAPINVLNEGGSTHGLFERQTLEPFIQTLRYRETREIVWSCLATIFACTWVSVHPPLPGLHDSRLDTIKARLFMMINAIIAPEMVVAWAVMRRSAAKSIAREFNERYHEGGNGGKVPRRTLWSSMRTLTLWLRGPRQNSSTRWTVAHGFLIQMGGFVLFEDNFPNRALSFDELKSMIETGQVDVPKVREDEIEDKSKGDFLTKVFVVFQTTWFVVQCFARWAAHLPVTELEVVTLAFGTLNVITYAVWWHKPQNVQVAFAVQLRDGFSRGCMTPAGEDTQEERCEDIQGEEIEGDLDEEPSHVKLYDSGVQQKRNRARSFFHAVKGMVNLSTAPHRITQVILGWSRSASRFYTRHGIIARQASILHVIDAFGDQEIILILAMVGVVFGAFHLIPWSSSFPSLIEGSLWRSSAAVITFTPLSIASMTYIYKVHKHLDSWFTGLLFALLTVPTILGIGLYVIARFILLILAFTTLRALSPAAHIAIEWASFVPHI